MARSCNQRLCPRTNIFLAPRLSHALKPKGKKMKNAAHFGLAVLWSLALASPAMAGSVYDGTWNLVFVTRRGACDQSYDFVVNISNGIVTHPNLVRFRGRVAKNGVVRASVTVGERYASGSGRLAGTSGRGVWSGRAGAARCAGDWVAQRT